MGSNVRASHCIVDTGCMCEMPCGSAQRVFLKCGFWTLPFTPPSRDSFRSTVYVCPVTCDARYSSYPYNATGLAHAACVNCTDGTPPPGTPNCPFQRGTPKSLGHPFRQMVAVAPNPAGPWTEFEIPGLTVGWDWNTALTINPDSSAVALIRGGMVWHASNYSDVSTWHAVGGLPQGPQWSEASIEDRESAFFPCALAMFGL
jgi:hypothetical protein